MNALQLHNLTVSRGSGPVISDIDLRVEPGTITAVVGPNGAGKTSLLEAISGIIAPSHGTISIGDRRVDKLSRVARTKLGLAHIEQGRAVFAGLTVAENLRLTAGSSAEVESVLTMFPELDERRNTRSGLLSGGEQQMVVLARSFAASPRFLLIDEMSLGLAPVVFSRLLPIVRRFAETGVGVLLVEQFTNMALDIAGEAVVVSSGQVTYQGEASALVADPQLLHTAYLGG